LRRLEALHIEGKVLVVLGKKRGLIQDRESADAAAQQKEPFENLFPNGSFSQQIYLRFGKIFD
jgi:hypothetical protein